MVFFLCLPAHHFSATNKNNLYYGWRINTNRTHWFLVFLHTSVIKLFKSISNHMST
jgi:hypothetical protein